MKLSQLPSNKAIWKELISAENNFFEALIARWRVIHMNDMMLLTLLPIN